MIEPVNGSNTTITVTPVPDASPGNTDPPPEEGTEVSASPTPDPRIMLQGRVLDAQRSVLDQIVPVAGATIFFINNSEGANNTTAFMTVSDPTGFYSIALMPGKYTLIASAPGFDTLIEPIECTETRTHTIILIPVLFNGFIPYAQNPVLETSPGRDVACTICVANSQVSDQMVTFSVVTPPDWEAWFPNGETLLVSSGQSCSLTFTLRYTGTGYGPFPMKVVVNGGAYSAEIPIIVVVKDLPFETIDLYCNAYYKEVTEFTIIRFPIKIKNNYKQGKYLVVNVDPLPEGWTWRTEDYSSKLSTRTDNRYYVYKDDSYDFLLRVFIPYGAKENLYPLNLYVYGDGVNSKALQLFVKVNNTRLIQANFIDENYTVMNNCCFFVTKNNTTSLRLNVYNIWSMPVKVKSTIEVDGVSMPDDRRYTFFSEKGYSSDSILIPPHDNLTIGYNVTSSNFTGAGSYNITIFLESTDYESAYNVDTVVLSTIVLVVNDTNDSSYSDSVKSKPSRFSELLLIFQILFPAGIIVYIILLNIFKLFVKK